MGKPRIRVDYALLNVPKFCCEVKGCKKFFSKLSRLKYHQNTHLEEKPYKCDYEGCISSYYRPNHLKRHVESTHSKVASSKAFVCSKAGCGAAFESEKSLSQHSRRKHCAQPLQCSFCSKGFSKKWMVKEHEAGHTGAFPFKCDVESCGETFKDFCLFKAHKRDHEKKTVKPQKCPVEGCTFTCNKWSELVAHKKTSHPTERQCPVCDKTFSPSNLKIHRQIHQEDRATIQCPIDGCPRFYFHQKNLSHHVKIKHEGFGFECTLCRRKLSSKQKLDRHIEVIHKNPNKKTKKVKLESVLSKLTTMCEADWNLKKTGPAPYIRQRYNCIKFSSSTETDGDALKKQHNEDNDNNNHILKDLV